MSFHKILLENIFSEDIFHVTKTTLYLKIFLNLYYLGNFLFFYTKYLKTPINVNVPYLVAWKEFLVSAATFDNVNSKFHTSLIIILFIRLKSM